MAVGERSRSQLVAAALSGEPVYNEEAAGIVAAMAAGTEAKLPIEAKQVLVDAAHAILFSESMVPHELLQVATTIVTTYGADEK